MSISELDVLFVIYLAYACGAVYFFFRQPFNIAFVVSVLNAFLYFIPPFALHFGLAAPDERMPYACDHRHVGALLSWALAIATGFLIGGVCAYYRSLRRVPINRMASTCRFPATPVPRHLLLVLALLWVAILMLCVKGGQLSLSDLFLPARKSKSEVFGSAFLYYGYFYLPVLVAVLVFLRSHRISWSFLGACLLSLGVALGTSQRRNFFVVLLVFVGAAVFLARSRPLWSKGSILGRIAKLRRMSLPRFLVSAALLVPLIPGLWWLRNAATSYSDSGVISNPLEVRGFWELVFASPGSGFRTFTYVYVWVTDAGIQWFHGLQCAAVAWVPRDLWPAKPEQSAFLLQEYFNFPMSPSVFLINDLYIQSGFFSPFFAIGCGYFLSNFHNYVLSRRTITHRLILVAVFANSVTLFKNGLALFVINTMVLCIPALCFVRLRRVHQEKLV